MVKWLLIVLVGLLIGCEVGDQESIDDQMIDSVPILTNNEDVSPIEVVNEPTLIITRMEGITDSYPEFFGSNYNLQSSLTGIEMEDYSRIFILYDPVLMSVLSTTTFGLEELSYGDIYQSMNEHDAKVTLILLNNKAEYQSFFSTLRETAVSSIDQPSVYDYFGVSGTSVFVESRGLDPSKLSDVLDSFTIRRAIRDEAWLYTSETIYLFLKNEEQAVLTKLGIELPSENNSVIQYTNPRGQTFIIGRSDSPFEREYFQDFVSLLVEDDFNGRTLQALPLEGLDDVRRSNISAEVCKLEETRKWSTQHTVSHEISSNRISSVGEVNGLVVLIDFEPYPTTEQWDETIETYEEYLEIVEKDLIAAKEFYKSMSGGKLTLEFDYYPEVVTVPLFLSESNDKFDPGFMELVNAHIDDVLRIVEEDYDLTQTEFLIFYWPFDTPQYARVYLAEMRENPLNTKNGEIYNYTLQVSSPYDNDYIVQHELAHVLGLMDLYLYEYVENKGLSPTDKYWHWDLMTQNGNEINGWHRWMLSWISDEEVQCIPNTLNEEYLVFLEPLNTIDATTRLITVNLSPTEAISIELRGPGEYCGDQCTQNVLVTHVDAFVNNGRGPMTILRPERSRDLLLVGDRITYENITITHVSRNLLGSMISISID